MPNDQDKLSKNILEDIKVKNRNDDQAQAPSEVDIDLTQEADEEVDSATPRCQLCWDAEEVVLLCDSPEDAVEAATRLDAPVRVQIKLSQEEVDPTGGKPEADEDPIN